MKLAVELSETEGARLRETAARLGVDPSQLAHAAIADLLGAPDDEFLAAAEHVLRKNEELDRRLA